VIAVGALFVLLFVALLFWGFLRPRYQIVFDYQRGVLYDKGVFERVLMPGLHWLPSWKTVSVVDMRLQVLTVPAQEVLSSDGISSKISLAGQYQVDNPKRSLEQTTHALGSLYMYAQQALRDVAATQTFEELLGNRVANQAKIFEAVTPKAMEIGLKVDQLEIRDIMLSGEMKRVFAQSLAAQKEGLAALERARGETAALRSLANAARMMEENPSLLQLRALQAMESSKGNTLVLGVGEHSLIRDQNRKKPE
jgi:regulator of protease activity HflC (stomatin/prohibitin superfamily)